MQLIIDLTKQDDVVQAWGLMCTVNPTMMLNLSKELVEGIGPVVKQDAKEKVTVPAPSNEPPPHEDSDRNGYEPEVKTEQVVDEPKDEPKSGPDPQDTEKDHSIADLQEMLKENLGVAKGKLGDGFMEFRQSVVDLIDKRYGVKKSSLIPAERVNEAYGELQAFFAEKL